MKNIKKKYIKKKFIINQKFYKKKIKKKKIITNYLYKNQNLKKGIFLKKPTLKEILYPFYLNLKLVNEYLKKK